VGVHHPVRSDSFHSRNYGEEGIVSNYHDWMEREGERIAFEDREAADAAMTCGGCGKSFSGHIGPQALCRQYHDLMDAVVHSHLGHAMAHAKLHDIAEAEIERRSR